MRHIWEKGGSVRLFASASGSESDAGGVDLRGNLREEPVKKQTIRNKNRVLERHGCISYLYIVS